jgi:hypothetical protein
VRLCGCVQALGSKGSSYTTRAQVDPVQPWLSEAAASGRVTVLARCAAARVVTIASATQRGHRRIADGVLADLVRSNCAHPLLPTWWCFPVERDSISGMQHLPIVAQPFTSGIRSPSTQFLQRSACLRAACIGGIASTRHVWM